MCPIRASIENTFWSSRCFFSFLHNTDSRVSRGLSILWRVCSCRDAWSEDPTLPILLWIRADPKVRRSLSHLIKTRISILGEIILKLDLESLSIDLRKTKILTFLSLIVKNRKRQYLSISLYRNTFLYENDACKIAEDWVTIFQLRLNHSLSLLFWEIRGS